MCEPCMPPYLAGARQVGEGPEIWSWTPMEAIRSESGEGPPGTSVFSCGHHNPACLLQGQQGEGSGQVGFQWKTWWIDLKKKLRNSGKKKRELVQTGNSEDWDFGFKASAHRCLSPIVCSQVCPDLTLHSWALTIWSQLTYLVSSPGSSSDIGLETWSRSPRFCASLYPSHPGVLS
jgi:hypothetical protein